MKSQLLNILKNHRPNADNVHCMTALLGWVGLKAYGFALILLLMPCSVWALRGDMEQVAHFVADHVSFNDKNGTTIYSGHVKMHQGTTHLMADEVTVYRDSMGGTSKVVAIGQQAHYTTLPDDQKNPIDAFGDRIEYYPPKRLAVIMGNGDVIQVKNRLKGPYIIYDMVKQTVSSVPSLAKGSERSWITLQPQDLPGQKKTD